MVGDTPWYKVITDKGDAFASGDYITILTPTEINRYANVASSTTTYAHVRDLPGASDEYTIVATLQNGASIDILEEYNPVGAEKPWYKIKYHKVNLEINDPLKGQEVHTEASLAFIDEDGIATFIDQNQLIQEFAASPFEGYKNTEIFGEGRLMHIFRGDVKKILSNEK